MVTTLLVCHTSEPAWGGGISRYHTAIKQLGKDQDLSASSAQSPAQLTTTSPSISLLSPPHTESKLQHVDLCGPQKSYPHQCEPEPDPGNYNSVPRLLLAFLFKIEIFYYNNEIFIQKVPMKILIEYIVLLQAQELFMQINQCPRYIDPSFS